MSAGEGVLELTYRVPGPSHGVGWSRRGGNQRNLRTRHEQLVTERDGPAHAAGGIAGRLISGFEPRFVAGVRRMSVAAAARAVRTVLDRCIRAQAVLGRAPVMQDETDGGGTVNFTLRHRRGPIVRWSEHCCRRGHSGSGPLPDSFHPTSLLQIAGGCRGNLSVPGLVRCGSLPVTVEISGGRREIGAFRVSHSQIAVDYRPPDKIDCPTRLVFSAIRR